MGTERGAACARTSSLRVLGLCEPSRWEILLVHTPGRLGPPERSAARFGLAALRQRVKNMEQVAGKNVQTMNCNRVHEGEEYKEIPIGEVREQVR